MLIDQPGLRDHWYVVAEATELGDHPLAVRLLGEDLVVWRSADGSLVALLKDAGPVAKPELVFAARGDGA